MSALPPPGTPGVLYLVDLSGYVFRAYHAIAPLSSSKGEPTHAVLGTVNMLQKVVNERRPDMLAVAMDSKRASFRKEIDARYKATRPAPPEDLSQQMRRVDEIVRAYNIPVYAEEGLEADDLIAAVVARAMREGDVRIVIVSADKDLMQLVRDDDDRVVLWDSMRDRVYGPQEVKEKFGVLPSQLRDVLALMGDTSDNIPGVPGIGPKTAADLMTEFGSIENLYGSLDKVKRPKVRASLAEHERDARLSQVLVTLKADADILWDRPHLHYGGANKEELRRLFTELEFTRLLEQIPAPPRIQKDPTCVLGLDVLRGILTTSRETKTLAIDLALSESDPQRAEILGLSLSARAGEGFYVPLRHRYLGAPKQLTWTDVAAELRPFLEDPAITKVGHEIKTAEEVLMRAGMRIEGAMFDTLLAAYLLDPEAPSTMRVMAERELDVALPEYEEERKKTRGPNFDELEVERATKYAGGRADVCVSLMPRLEPRLEKDGLAKLYREVELPLSRVLASVESAGVLVDVARLQAVSRRIADDLKSLEAKAKEAAGSDFAVRSRDQLEKILFDDLKLPVLKRTPKGGRSTDAEVLEDLAERHPLPKLICEFRELDKLKGTYLDALPRYVNPTTGRIHTRFEQAVAATGRLSSKDPNLQNIPIRTEVGREIRSAFVAPPGFFLVSADYSQIELRVLAHLSQDKELVQAFQSGDDIHTHTASLVFDVPKANVTSEMRRRSKTINFGVIYGMGDSALAKQLGITREEAARFITAYFERYEGVRRFMEKTVEAARRGEAVRTLLGRRRFLPNLHSANRGLRFEAERVAKNTPIQGTAADILKLAMVRLDEAAPVPRARMILTVHDELVFEVPENDVDRAKERIAHAMSTVLPLDVPLVVDVGHGKDWRAAH